MPSDKSNFDPYRKWLGIPTKDQPPNHYRLLGVEVFESDADVIDAHANKQMTYLHEFGNGEHAELGEKLLNEIAVARLCLLSADKKAAYDAELRTQLATHTPAPPTPPPRPATTPVDQHQPPIHPTAPVLLDAPADGISRSFSTKNRRIQKRSRFGLAKIIGGGVAGLVLGYLLLCWIAPQSDFLGLTSSSKFESVAFDDRNVVPDQESPEPRPELHPESKPETPVVEHPLQKQPSVFMPSSNPLPPVADDPKQPDTPEESKEDRLVRLAAERDAALESGDVAVALKAIEGIAGLDGGDVLSSKLEVVMKLQDSADSPDDFKIVAENLLPLLEQAISENRKDVAERHISEALLAARKSGDSDLARRATLCVLKLQTMKAP